MTSFPNENELMKRLLILIISLTAFLLCEAANDTTITVPSVKRCQFYYYDFYFSYPHSYPRMCSAVAEKPLDLSIAHDSIDAFINTIYSKAYYSPDIYFGMKYLCNYEWYNNDNSEYRKTHDFNIIDDLLAETADKVYHNSKEYKFILKDKTKLNIKVCFLDGFFWECNSSDKRLNGVSIDYTRNESIKRKEKSYVLKEVISVEPY